MADLVLLSGGIDSIVCAEDSRRRGELAGCVFVDYGHPAQVQEGWKAFAYCGSRRVTLKVIHAFGLDLGDMKAEEGARVVPSRNAALLSLASNAAAGLGANALVIGCNAADQRDYSDCRAAFLESMGCALGIPIHAPLIGLSKAEIVSMAQAMGFGRDAAWSCYGAGPAPCGECPSCIEADRAWGQCDRGS